MAMTGWIAIILGFAILQRLAELRISKRNTDILKAKGGYEAGREHYKYIVILHVIYFISIFAEVLTIKRGIPAWWPLPLASYLFGQGIRIWSMMTLKERWTTRIIILPHAEPIDTGPYRFMKHPIYIAVGLELLSLALFCGAYLTAIVFPLLHGAMMLIRIPAEEQALRGSKI
jgi:methyltransferase